MALVDELVWFYQETGDDDIYEKWSQMPLYIAWEVERLFRCSKHCYSEQFDKYVFDFTTMIQINIVTGRRRPIRRRVRLVHLDVR